MKKTALQQLIDSWEERKPNGSYGLIWQAFIDEATEFLEIEREQIEEAYDEGYKDAEADMQQNKQTCGFCVTPEKEIIIHLVDQEKRDCLIAFDDWFNKNWYPEQYSILAIEAYLKTIQ